MYGFDKMTIDQQMEYDLAHTEHARQRYVAADYKRAQNILLAGLGVIIAALYMMVPLVEMLVIG